MENAYNVQTIVLNATLMTFQSPASFANKIQLGIGCPKNVHSLLFQTAKNRLTLNAKSVKMVSILTRRDVIVVTSKDAFDAVLWMIIRNARIASLGTHLWSNMMRVECTMLVKRMEFKEILMLLRNRKSLVLD